MPVTGGLPRRVTHHGAPDRMLGWYPDGNAILFATMMTSGKDRFNQLYKVARAGGLPESLASGAFQAEVARTAGERAKNVARRKEPLTGVSEFPAREKCASLPWHTLHAVLDGKSNPISTE